MAPAQVALHRARPLLLRPPLLLRRSSRAAPRRMVPMPMAAQVCRSRRSPLRRRSRHSACPLKAARPAYQQEQRRTRPAILSTAPTNPRDGATFPRLFGATSGNATEDGYRDPLTGRRCTSSHLLQIDHLLPVAQGGGPDPDNLVLRCFAHHRMRHGHGPATPPEPPR